MSQHNPTHGTALATIRWMVNSLSNAAVQTYFTRDGDRAITASLICDVLERACALFYSFRRMKDAEWAELMKGLIARKTASGTGCPDGWEGDGRTCVPCSAVLDLKGFPSWRKLPREAPQKTGAFEPTAADAFALEQIRWLLNTLENAAIEMAMGDRGVDSTVLNALFFRIHDSIVALVAKTPQEAAPIHAARLRPAQAVVGCPPGWGCDARDGFFSPLLNGVPRKFSMPPKTTRVVRVRNPGPE